MRRSIANNLTAIVLTANRRVDVVLSTTGQKSTRFLPHNAQDFEELIGGGMKPARTAKPAKPKAAKKVK